MSFSTTPCSLWLLLESQVGATVQWASIPWGVQDMFAVRDLKFTSITCFPKLCVWFFERQEVKEGVARKSSDLQIPSSMIENVSVAEGPQGILWL